MKTRFQNVWKAVSCRQDLGYKENSRIIFSPGWQEKSTETMRGMGFEPKNSYETRPST
jgi:hypothetical protein